MINIYDKVLTNSSALNSDELDQNILLSTLGLYVAWYFVSVGDNCMAINKAKNKLINLLDTSNDNQRKSEKIMTNCGEKFENNIQVRLIKLAREKKEITKADCVLETGMSSKKIQAILNEMLKDELITVSNRTEDGAVVYRSL